MPLKCLLSFSRLNSCDKGFGCFCDCFGSCDKGFGCSCDCFSKVAISTFFRWFYENDTRQFKWQWTTEPVYGSTKKSLGKMRLKTILESDKFGLSFIL